MNETTTNLIPETDRSPLDVSPFEFSMVEQNDRRLMFERPLILEPRLEGDAPRLLVVTDEELDLRAFAETRDQLVEEITAHLFFLWDEFAQEADEKLSPVARRLKQRLLERFRETHNAEATNGR